VVRSGSHRAITEALGITPPNSGAGDSTFQIEKSKGPSDHIAKLAILSTSYFRPPYRHSQRFAFSALLTAKQISLRFSAVSL